MREILFRGKRIDNGEWVEGAYYKHTHFYGDPSEKHYIIVSSEDLGYDQAIEYFEVDPSTVGQFTGLADKNCKRIFEGDIVGMFGHYGVVGYGEFNCSCCDGVYGWGFGREDIREHEGYEVVGNIHDNPELLEGGTDHA